jgi:hypothetical protein
MNQSLIIQPANTETARHFMERWADAFAATIEIRAEAAHDAEIRKTLTDATRKVKSMDLGADEKNKREHLVEGQEMINMAVRKLGMDDYNDQKVRWKRLKPKIIGSGWDLHQEIHFELTRTGILVWQGGDDILTKTRSGIPFSGADAAMVNAFLEFVQAYAERQIDPRIYTQQLLESQGVTRENFHLHAENIAFDNPWE